MKDVLFKGKSLKDGAWVCGSLYLTTHNAYIIPTHDEFTSAMEKISVDKDTIGQFTELTDKNGKRVFEGDVIGYTEHKGYLLKSFYAVVSYKDHAASFAYLKLGLDENGCKQSMIHFFNEADEFEEDILPYLEVIGNVYDNPELLSHD